MGIDEKYKSELIKIIYEQNFLHERQAVTERHWFTSVYVVVVSGVLSFLSTVGSERFFSAIFLSLLIFSVIGFLIALKLGAEVTNIFNKINRLASDHFKELKPYVAFPVERWKVCHLRYFYPLVYSITAAIWATLLFNPLASREQLILAAFVGLSIGITFEIAFYADP